jgi:hypothetical protein
MAMPAEIPFPDERLHHKLLYNLPVRRKFEDVNTERTECLRRVLFQLWAKEQMIETYDQWFNPVFFHEITKGEGTVLPAAERDKAVIVIFATILFYDLIKLLFTLFPIDAVMLVFMLMADIADPAPVELDCLVCLRQRAF